MRTVREDGRLDKDDIEIYRPKSNGLTVEEMKYDDIDSVVEEGKIKLVVKNR